MFSKLYGSIVYNYYWKLYILRSGEKRDLCFFILLVGYGKYGWLTRDKKTEYDDNDYIY